MSYHVRPTSSIEYAQHMARLRAQQVQQQLAAHQAQFQAQQARTQAQQQALWWQQHQQQMLQAYQQGHQQRQQPLAAYQTQFRARQAQQAQQAQQQAPLQARTIRENQRRGYNFGSDDDDDECCEYCDGDGCEECDDDGTVPRTVQCRGITQRGARCQITSDSAHDGQRRFADAAEPLTCGSHYCAFHTEQEWERESSESEHVCYECDGEGCPECGGEGCEECLDDVREVPPPVVSRATHTSSAAIPAAPSEDEVAIVGYRSRQERDAEARRHAIDVESDGETAQGSAICPAKPAAKPAAKGKLAAPAKPAAQASKPSTKPVGKRAAPSGPAAPAEPATRAKRVAAAEPAAPTEQPLKGKKRTAAEQAVEPIANEPRRTRSRVAATTSAAGSGIKTR